MRLIASAVLLIFLAIVLIPGCTNSTPAVPPQDDVSLTVMETTKHYTSTEGECYWEVQVEIKNNLASRATDVQAWVKLLEGDGSVKDKAAINVDSIGAGETKLFTKKLYGDCGTEYGIDAYIDA